MSASRGVTRARLVGLLAVVVSAIAVGCGGASPPGKGPPMTPAARAESPAATPRPSGLHVVLRPDFGPPARVHVELEVATGPATPPDLVGLLVEPREVHARDDRGTLDATVHGAAVHLSRAPVGVLHVGYDVPAVTSASVDPLATLVQEDRFRAAGERLLLLPKSALSAAVVDIDGSALRAPRAASTVGGSSTRAVRAGGLLHASFVGGSLYSAVFDAEAHDEAAWLGYTAFDPRPASAELAQIRTAIGEFFRAELPPFTTLFVSQARPLGSFSTHRRAGGVLVLLGPSQPWDAALRLSITEQIVHGWIGGDIQLAAANEREAKAHAWFTDGVNRFVAMRFLARLGLLSPDEVRAIVAGEMAAVTTSPHRGESAADLASDPRPTARAELTARGALAALRIHRLLRDRSKGARSFDDLLLAMAQKARAQGGPLPADTFDQLVAAELGEAELATFRATVSEGRPPPMPPRALGPCFRDGVAAYVGFDLGFDEAETLAAAPRVLHGLRPDGPAARAGARPDDELVALDEPSPGAATGKGVVLTVRRNAKEDTISYAPEGARARGPSWTRIEGMPATKCGDVP